MDGLAAQMKTRRRARWPRYALLAVLLLALLAIRAQRERQPEVEVAPARFDRLTLPLAASGLVEGRAADLGFKETGLLVRLYVSEGERVQRGQPLARIHPSTALVPFTDSEGEVIQAPEDGFVVVLYRHPGAVVNPGEPVLRLVQAGALWITAFVEAEDAVLLRSGQPLTCRAGGYLSPPLTMVVTSVGQEAVPRPDLPASSRQVRVRCAPKDLSFSLPPGTEVDVDGQIPLCGRALVIPANALVHRDGAEAVWVVRPGGTVTQRPVAVGPNNFALVALTRGLAEGETVVVEGKEGLREGQRVRTRPLPPLEAQP